MFSGTSCRGVSAWLSSFEFWRFAQRYLLVLRLIHKAVRAEFWVSSPTSLAATSERGSNHYGRGARRLTNSDYGLRWSLRCFEPSARHYTVRAEFKGFKIF